MVFGLGLGMGGGDSGGGLWLNKEKKMQLGRAARDSLGIVYLDLFRFFA